MAITVAMRTEISQLYVALFGRAPDGEGLGYWVGLRDAGQTLTQIANTMYATAPARDYYPLFLTNQEIIASFYVNVLGRTADAEGLAFWTAKLNAAGATPGSVITEMVSVVANYAGTDAAGLTSKALFNNKVQVAQYYGEQNGNIADATIVLSTVTSAAASVTAAKAAIDGGYVGQDGLSFTLKTTQDDIHGSTGADVVSGIFGGATGDTYTAGDAIDLGDGALDSVELAVQGAAVSAAVVIKNTEFVTIQDTIGGTLNGVLIEGSPTIAFASTLAGQSSTVINASQTATYGLSGKGNLVVDFLSTTGTTDAAKVSLNTVGTSTAARSTVDVGDTNTVEKATIATAGTNFVTLKAGGAATSVVITGAGVNNWDLSAPGAVAAVMNVDASAATGANTFVLGTTLNTSDVLKGGTAADTASANFTGATLVKPTFTGVETLSLDFDAVAVLDLGATTGTTAITLGGSSTDQAIQKAAADVVTVNVQSQADNDNDLSFLHATGVNAALTLNIGTTASTAADFNLDAVTLGGIAALTINTVGSKSHNITGGITVNDSVDSLAVNVGASQYLYASGLYVDGTMGNVTTKVGADAQFWQSVFAESVGNVTVDMGAGASGGMGIDASDGDVGNVTATATGDNSNVYVWVNASGASGAGDGNIGNLTLTVNGDEAHGWLYAQAEGGDIGNINVSVQGSDASGYLFVSAMHRDYTDAPNGDIGDVTINVGKDAYFSGSINAISGGSIGDIGITVGDNAWSALSLKSDGGEIGAITITAGDGAGAGLYFESGNGSIGTVGDITATMGDDASLRLNVSGNYQFGDITATFGDNGSFSGYWNSWQSGGVGDVNMTFGDDGRFDMYFASGNTGDVGNITTTFGDGGNFSFRHVSGFDGNIGNIHATFGTGGYFSFEAMSGGGSDMEIGDTTLSFGTGGNFYWTISGGDYANIGAITVTGGSASSSGYVYIGDTSDTTADVMGGVDASAWLGSIYVELDAVTTGTTIKVGAAGSVVYGTEGADNIFMGAGVDVFHFDTSPTSVDTIFAFTGGASKDVLDIQNTANLTTYTVNTAHVVAAGDLVKLVNLSGGEDITTAAGLKAALNAGGEYASLDTAGTGGNFTFLTANSATSNQFFVFNATDANDADADFDTVTLVGIVNMTGTNFSSLVSGNFS